MSSTTHASLPRASVRRREGAASDAKASATTWTKPVESNHAVSNSSDSNACSAPGTSKAAARPWRCAKVVYLLWKSIATRSAAKAALREQHDECNNAFGSSNTILFRRRWRRTNEASAFWRKVGFQRTRKALSRPP